MKRYLYLAGLLATLALPQAYAGERQRSYSESEFIKLVIGRSADEVRAALGEPVRVREQSESIQHWTYERVVVIGRGPALFSATDVVMVQGRVDHLMNHGPGVLP